MDFSSNRLAMWCAVLAAAFGGQVEAAPSVTTVSGTVEHGMPIVISGSGFGSHADYGGSQSFLCNGWQDFETGSLQGGNFTIDNLNVWQLRTTNTKPNSSYHGMKYYNGTRLGELRIFTKPDTHEFYSSFWIMLTQPTMGNDGGKFWRIWSDIHEDNIYLATGGDNTMIRGYSESQRVSGSTQWGSPNSIGYGQWHRIEIWMDDSPSEFTVWMDGVFQWTHDDWVPNPWYSGTHTWAVGHMINDCNGGHNFDDVYMSNTRARIEIGNASTWSACTHREVQIPTSWSSGSITATVNQGSFADGASAYLYVVDAEGAASASGYPITIGQVSHSLTVTNGNGSGEYDEGEVVAISADPAPSGKLFAWWIGGIAHISDRMQPATTVTMPAEDVSVTATYAWGYQLTVNNGTGDGLYLYGTVVDIQADAAPTNMAFDEWTGDTGQIAEPHFPATTLTMPSKDCEVTAMYVSAVEGDLDASGFVGQADLDIILANWGDSPPADPRADPSGDNMVGQSDLDIVLYHWGEGTLR